MPSRLPGFYSHINYIRETYALFCVGSKPIYTAIRLSSHFIQTDVDKILYWIYGTICHDVNVILSHISPVWAPDFPEKKNKTIEKKVTTLPSTKPTLYHRMWTHKRSNGFSSHVDYAFNCGAIERQMPVDFQPLYIKPGGRLSVNQLSKPTPCCDP